MYKPKYNAVSQMKGNKKAGLAHSNSMAMMIGPDKKGKKNDAKTGESKVEVELKAKEPTEYINKKSGGTIEIKKSTVDSAKAKKGYFKEMPEFKGTLMKRNGRTYGYKTHEGEFIKATNPVDVKKATTQYEKDKKLYEKTKSDKDATTKRMATPVDKRSGK